MGRSSKVYVRLRKLSLSRKMPQREEGAHVDTSCLANHYCKNPTLPTQILLMPEPQIRHHWLLAMSQKVLFWFKWCSVHCHDCIPVSLLQLTLACKSRWDPHSDHPPCGSLKEIFAKGYIGDVKNLITVSLRLSVAGWQWLSNFCVKSCAELHFTYIFFQSFRV